MNKRKFLAMLAAHGENQAILSNALGMSRITLSRKISENHNSVFTQPEIIAIKKRYDLSCEEVDDIFFTN